MKREVLAWTAESKGYDGWLSHDGEDWCWSQIESMRVFFREEDWAAQAYRRYVQATNGDWQVESKPVPVYTPKGYAAAGLRARIAVMRHVCGIERSPEKTLDDIGEALGLPALRYMRQSIADEEERAAEEKASGKRVITCMTGADMAKPIDWNRKRELGESLIPAQPYW